MWRKKSHRSDKFNYRINPWNINMKNLTQFWSWSPTQEFSEFQKCRYRTLFLCFFLPANTPIGSMGLVYFTYMQTINLNHTCRWIYRSSHGSVMGTRISSKTPRSPRANSCPSCEGPGPGGWMSRCWKLVHQSLGSMGQITPSNIPFISRFTYNLLIRSPFNY